SSSPGGTPPSAGGSARVPAASSASGAPSPIDGMYSSGTSILTLKGGRWTRTLPDMAGTFNLSGNDLQLSDQPGCPGQGTYGWRLADDLLTLTKVREACA